LLKVVYDYYRYIDPFITFYNILCGIWIHSTRGTVIREELYAFCTQHSSNPEWPPAIPIVDCSQSPRLQKVHRWTNKVKISVHILQRASYNLSRIFNNDPSAGSPTETLLRLLLPLNDQVWSARVDYVPALCTHRPSLLPIEWLSEVSGLALGSRQRHPIAEKLIKLGHLEEVKVVTRFP